MVPYDQIESILRDSSNTASDTFHQYVKLARRLAYWRDHASSVEWADEFSGYLTDLYHEVGKFLITGMANNVVDVKDAK